LLLVHGTSRSDKEWPAPHWISLGQQLAGDGYDLALPHGNAAELATSEALAAGINAAAGGQVARVWPRLPLDALTQRMAACCGVIGVDSGLSHLAVALDLPHVQLYNFETAWRTGPAPAQAQAQSAARQQSVYAAPTPSLAAVLAAWRSVSATHAAVAQPVPRPAA
jgi:heptosyltransferase-1